MQLCKKYTLCIYGRVRVKFTCVGENGLDLVYLGVSQLNLPVCYLCQFIKGLVEKTWLGHIELETWVLIFVMMTVAIVSMGYTVR